MIHNTMSQESNQTIGIQPEQQSGEALDRMGVALLFCFMSIDMVVALYPSFWPKVEKVNHSIEVIFIIYFFKLHIIKLLTQDIGEGLTQAKQQGALVGGHHGSG